MNTINKLAIVLSSVLVTSFIVLYLGQIASADVSVNLTHMNGRTAITTPTPGEIPIVASTAFDRVAGPRKGDVEGIIECGFNVCMNSSTVEDFEKMLGYLEGSDLKLIIHGAPFRYVADRKNDSWKKDLMTFVNAFKENPSVAGWELVDEPQWSLLSNYKERYNALLEADSTHFVLINLVGELAKNFTGPCKTLGEYLDSMQSVFKMDAWSSDCYPIWIRNDQLIVRYDVFYACLEAYAKKSKESGIPMWSYCESMHCDIGNHHTLPAATESYLSFEAFSALAYGAQGIVYWTYWQRPSNSYETYISALVDLDGNKTPAWYAAQTVNRQIRALTPVFLGAEMVECRHTGDIQMKNKVDQISDFGPLSKLTNGNKGVLASHLRNGDKDYLLIVNHDVQSKQRVKMNFAKDAVVSQLKVSSSGNVTRKKVGGAHNVTLTPGGYCLLEWSR